MAHISTGISKLGGAAISVGFTPIVTCRPGAPCCHDCYACKGRYRTPIVKQNLKENTQEWHDDPVGFTNDLRNATILAKYFRWFHAGDIIDKPFLGMMFDLAEEVGSTRFLAFSKKFELVNNYLAQRRKPQNLVLALSAWGDDFIPENPYNLPMAYVRLPNKKCTIPAYAKECNGSCKYCILHLNGGCWNLKEGEAVVFNYH